MDMFAYFRFYRRCVGGEWVYIYDHRFGIYHWVTPVWLGLNRWNYEYNIFEYEYW